MSFILPRDQIKYIDKIERERILAYGSSFYLPKDGDGLNNLGEQYYGEDLGDVIKNIFSFINTNKDSIKNVSETIGSVGNTASNITKNIIENIQKAKEIKKTKIPVSDDAKLKILSNGSGFYTVK